MFAKPVTRGFVPGWMAAEEETRVVIFVDNSASMSLIADKISLLENSKALVKNIIECFEEKTTIELYQTNPVKRVFTGNPGGSEFGSHIANIKQTHSHDNLWNTVNSVLEKLQEMNLQI